MDDGARTPEELEDRFEDALMMRDPAALGGLFTPEGVLAMGDGPEASGAAIGALAARSRAHAAIYVGGAQRVLQARDLALVASPAGTHVARRMPDGRWRLAISLIHRPTPEEER